MPAQAQIHSNSNIKSQHDCNLNEYGQEIFCNFEQTSTLRSIGMIAEGSELIHVPLEALLIAPWYARANGRQAAF